MCCDGPAGLPEAARGGPGPTPWSPPAWSTPVRATRAVRRPQGTARGSPPPGARACTAPDEEAARRAPGAFRQSDPGPRAPPDGGDVGEGLGEVHPLPGLPPGPAPGHLCTTNAIESLNHRAARSAENRGHFPSDEAAARTAVAGGSATSRTAGPRSAPRRRTRPPTRAGPTGGLVEGQVTTNRSAPPAGPPGSPPPTPTESTPTSDRTRLHRNIDRLTRSINRDPGETGPDPGRLEGTCRGLSDPDPERSSAPTTACAASRSPLRMSKSDLRVRPIYHHLRQSIEVHPTSPKPSTTSTTTLNEPSRARRALRVAAPVAPTDRTVLRRKERHGGPPGQEDAQGLD